MKRWIIGLSALAVVGAVPFVGNSAVQAEIQEIKDAIVAAIRQPEVSLTLSVAKQVITIDDQGKEEISWEALSNQAVVQPGDTVRYTGLSANTGDIEAQDLDIVQPIPAQTTFVIGSATMTSNAKLTYSIDGGQSFVETPMVKVALEDGTIAEVPAPAETYTHVKWSFEEALESDASMQFTYDVVIE